MNVRLKALGVTLITIIIAASVWLFLPARKDADQGELGRPLRVGIVTWPGYAGGIVANEGFKPNKKCIFWKQYGLLVEFTLLEDVDVLSKAFARGDVDVIWTTVDFWANQLPGFVDQKVPAKAFLQVDWSRGGDAIVADKAIETIEMLANSRVALTLLTPSHWFLEYKLMNSSLTQDQKDEIIKNVVAKNASPDARLDFVARRVQAAVVWEPDVTAALKERPDAHILASTRTDTHLLSDLMAAKTLFIETHPQAIRAFVRGWLDGTALATTDPDLVARLLTENEPVYTALGIKETKSQLSTVHWADLSDNIEMFGLHSAPPKFDEIYSLAGQFWMKRGFIKRVVPPAEAVDSRFIKEIVDGAKP